MLGPSKLVCILGLVVFANVNQAQDLPTYNDHSQNSNATAAGNSAATNATATVQIPDQSKATADSHSDPQQVPKCRLRDGSVTTFKAYSESQGNQEKTIDAYGTTSDIDLTNKVSSKGENDLGDLESDISAASSPTKITATEPITPGVQSANDMSTPAQASENKMGTDTVLNPNTLSSKGAAGYDHKGHKHGEEPCPDEEKVEPVPVKYEEPVKHKSYGSQEPPQDYQTYTPVKEHYKPEPVKDYVPQKTHYPADEDCDEEKVTKYDHVPDYEPIQDYVEEPKETYEPPKYEPEPVQYEPAPKKTYESKAPPVYEPEPVHYEPAPKKTYEGKAPPVEYHEPEPVQYHPPPKKSYDGKAPPVADYSYEEPIKPKDDCDCENDKGGHKKDDHYGSKAVSGSILPDKLTSKAAASGTNTNKDVSIQLTGKASVLPPKLNDGQNKLR